MIKRRMKSQVRDIGGRINKLVQNGFSYQEIANILGIKSRQLARYHFIRYRGINAKVAKQNQK
ncbi:MAG: hypothetical protein QMD65_01925 [Patescibacteria group bacterium]|nr:hypothetical protein [Patescibacteria group bacterium]